MRYRNQLRDRLLALLIFIVGALCVIFPVLTQDLAVRLGIGRGADLVFYFAIIGGLYFLAVFDIRLREKEEQITKLARGLAIATAHQPEKSSFHQR